MFLFDGTIGWSRTPLKKKNLLPCPVVSCCPGNYGYLLTHSDNWLQKFTNTVEYLTIDFITKDDSKK